MGKLWSGENLFECISILFKGPGWSPGKPRLGDPHDDSLFLRRNFNYLNVSSIIISAGVVGMASHTNKSRLKVIIFKKGRETSNNKNL